MRTEITRNVLTAFLALLLLALTSGAPAAAAEPTPQASTPPSGEQTTINGEISLGGQARVLRGNKWSKFDFYRDVPRGFFLENFLFEMEKPGTPWMFSLSGNQAAERDRRFRLVGERFGKFRFELRWTETPHFSSRLTQTLDVFGSERYRVADPVRFLLETAPTASLPSTIQGLLVGTPFEDIRSRRRRFEYLQTITPSTNWRIQFGVMTESRTGFRPIGLGTYERIGTPLGGTFRLFGDELPEPLDYRTTEVRAGVAYERSRGFLRFDYVASFFQNHIDNLIWDNPFRLTEAQGTLPAGATGRWRFATGLLDLWPDNRAHTVSFSGGLNLPHRTRIIGLVSLSWWRQDDAFVPFTSNTAVSAQGCVAPFPPTCLPAGVTPASLAALPARNLDGKIRVHNQDWALSSRLTDTVRVVARYRLYDYKNDSKEILFPGYVAFGDAFWRTNIENEPIENLTPDYTRQQSGVEVSWRPRKAFAWKNEFAWEAWNRRERQVARTNEWFYRTQMILQPVKWFYAKLNYRYGDRNPQGRYATGVKEFNQLRMFDQIHRISHSPDILLTFTPIDRFTFSASYGYRSQRFDDHFYGLITQLWNNFTLDASYAVNDKFNFFASFTRERYRTSAKEVAKTGSSNFNIRNTFVRDTNDRLNSFDFGFDAAAWDGRLNWNVTYGFALARLRFLTYNPFPIETATTLEGTAFPLPNISDQFQDVRTTISYKIRPNLTLGLRYLLEPRILHDFTTDILQPYRFGLLAPENDATRFLFLDARDSSYHGHAAAIFLR